MILGGYVYPKTGVALGPLTIRMLDDVHVHQTILSVGGITGKGLFNSNLLLVETERQMMRCADEVVVRGRPHQDRPARPWRSCASWPTIDTLIVDPGMTPAQREVARPRRRAADRGRRNRRSLRS